MLLFRSEEHLDAWLAERGDERGGTLTLDQLWRLASAWYRGKMEPDWRRRTADEAQEVFRSIGLTSDFWRLT